MNHWISFLRHNSFFFITVFFFKTVACKSVWYSFIKKLISSYKNSKTSVKNWIQIPNYNVFSRNYTTIITDVGKTEKLKTYVFLFLRKRKILLLKFNFFCYFNWGKIIFEIFRRIWGSIRWNQIQFSFS